MCAVQKRGAAKRGLKMQQESAGIEQAFAQAKKRRIMKYENLSAENIDASVNEPRTYLETTALGKADCIAAYLW